MILLSRGIAGPSPAAIGFGRSTWLLKRGTPVVPTGARPDYTDPDLAQWIASNVADPLRTETDPDAALLIAAPTADPSRTETDPDAAQVIVL